jgi:hypothetical protein
MLQHSCRTAAAAATDLEYVVASWQGRQYFLLEASANRLQIDRCRRCIRCR